MENNHRRNSFGWTEAPPVSSGMYLYQNDREWPYRLVVVGKGNWQLAQNPDWLYANEKLVENFDRGWWYGPIPVSPKDEKLPRDGCDPC